MPSWLEIAANLTVAASIFLAARNSIWTWWATFVGCGLFALLCWQNQLYADFTLQLFFIGTAVWGLRSWSQGTQGVRPIQSIAALPFALFAVAAIAVAAAYALLLHLFTDAYAPFWDSLVLTLSVLAQFLLVRRYLENWWCWLVVNSIAIPLYYSRGLELTALFYALYWLNVCYGMWQWRQFYQTQSQK
jgi:nicotinamide mononucleotide transporter